MSAGGATRHSEVKPFHPAGAFDPPCVADAQRHVRRTHAVCTWRATCRSVGLAACLSVAGQRGQSRVPRRGSVSMGRCKPQCGPGRMPQHGRRHAWRHHRPTPSACHCLACPAAPGQPCAPACQARGGRDGSRAATPVSAQPRGCIQIPKTLV
eukprot:363862-Chlamydomonas_euryale.AAC.19